MLDLTQIMKSVIYLAALIVLLTSVVAFLPNHHDQEVFHKRGQQVLEPVEEGSKSTNVTPSREQVDLPVARIMNYPTSKIHGAALEILDAAGTAPLDAYDSTTVILEPYLSRKQKFVIGTSRSQWAITYAPYNDDLTCKFASAIAADVASIASKAFTSVRLYATDCRALQYVGAAAAAHGLKMIIGVHIDDPILGLAQPQILEIAAWATGAGHWEMVEMVVIGNEAIFNELTEAASLAAFIKTARTTLRQAGYKGPITTTEPLSILSDHAKALCPILDVAAANIHPFFHADISADTAGEYVLE